MCAGTLYEYHERELTMYFPNPRALLPVKKKSGKVMLIPWGRRQQQAGNLPLGGWARLTSIKQGHWDHCFPRPVKIPLIAFMERDIEGKQHWFELTAGQWVQGLLARYDNEVRVYVVTIAPQKPNAMHERWPRILRD